MRSIGSTAAASIAIITPKIANYTAELDFLAYFSERHSSTKATSANRRLTVFKRYFHWALRERHTRKDPTLKILPARHAQRSPSNLTKAQVEALDAPDISTALGLRDRAVQMLLGNADISTTTN